MEVAHTFNSIDQVEASTSLEFKASLIFELLGLKVWITTLNFMFNYVFVGVGVYKCAVD